MKKCCFSILKILKIILFVENIRKQYDFQKIEQFNTLKY